MFLFFQQVPTCGNVPTVYPPSNVQNCTNEELFNRYYIENLCLPERRQAYIINVLTRFDTNLCGGVTPSSIVDTCSIDANGVPCGALFFTL